MARQCGDELGELSITPEERRLLAKVAQKRGVGSDYLALRAAAPPLHSAAGRPIPRWLDRRPPAPLPPVPRRPHAAAQARHCRSCALLSTASQPAAGRACVCSAGVWTSPLQQQSLSTSRRLRRLSLDCAAYRPIIRPPRNAPHHCRACRELVPADTVDERFVCGRGVWLNPMKPQSVANARRIARLSAACTSFAPRPGRWIARSKRSAP